MELPDDLHQFINSKVKVGRFAFYTGKLYPVRI